MITTSKAPAERIRPKVLLSRTEHDRLVGLATAAMNRFPEVAPMLLDELDRAELAPDERVPATVVAMHSFVTYHDAESGTTRQVQLVYPRQADIAEGRISVLTPIGAALIGLREGQSIDWPTRDGRYRRLTVQRVGGEPPAASAAPRRRSGGRGGAW